MILELSLSVFCLLRFFSRFSEDFQIHRRRRRRLLPFLIPLHVIKRFGEYLTWPWVSFFYFGSSKAQNCFSPSSLSSAVWQNDACRRKPGIETQAETMLFDPSQLWLCLGSHNPKLYYRPLARWMNVRRRQLVASAEFFGHCLARQHETWPCWYCRLPKDSQLRRRKRSW